MDFREVSHSSVINDYSDVYSGTSSDRKPATTNLILNALPLEMSRLIKPSLKPVILTKEQFLYLEEDRLDYIYFPETAVVSEFKILEDGRMVEISVTGKEGAVVFRRCFRIRILWQIAHRFLRQEQHSVSMPKPLTKYFAQTKKYGRALAILSICTSGKSHKKLSVICITL